jgi:hypothetical protein
MIDGLFLGVVDRDVYMFCAMYFRARHEWPQSMGLIARCIGESYQMTRSSVLRLVNAGVLERDHRNSAPVIIKNWEG